MKEWDAMHNNGVFEFTKRPPERKTVQSKWVFDKKLNEKGEVIRYKARLCAKGFTQIFGIDYNLTYSPTIDRSAINILITYCLHNKLIVKQFDVETAFLQAKLEEEIFMEIPEGLKTNSEDNVIQLKKAIYGLRQSSKVFNDKLTFTLKNLGWIQLKSDPCVFKRNSEIIAAFVDDCMVGSTSENSYNQIVRDIALHLKLVDQGGINHFLKIKIEYNLAQQYCKLSQPVFIDKIIEFCGISSSESKLTPLDVHTQLRQSNEEPHGVRPYREVVGQLLYLATCTRPDIYHAVIALSQFNNNYSKPHGIN